MRSLLSILISLFATTIFSQDISCSNFKIGKFKYANPQYSEWSISRTDSVQIETNTKTGIEIYSSVKWESECYYILTCIKVLNSDSKNIVGKIFRVSITETYKDYYKCISKSDDTQFQDLKLQMVKIE